MRGAAVRILGLPLQIGQGIGRLAGVEPQESGISVIRVGRCGIQLGDVHAGDPCVRRHASAQSERSAALDSLLEGVVGGIGGDHQGTGVRSAGEQRDMDGVLDGLVLEILLILGRGGRCVPRQ